MEPGRDGSMNIGVVTRPFVKDWRIAFTGTEWSDCFNLHLVPPLVTEVEQILKRLASSKLQCIKRRPRGVVAILDPASGPEPNPLGAMYSLQRRIGSAWRPGALGK
jgi:hypothetical protein